jgi:exopolyphosphatase/guanosine-5'-triphosphate,3'-diphosphate pyrophosphatase
MEGMPRYAAVDIGSNSIRMQAAETGAGMATKILAAERQVTRLGAGVFHDGRITADAMAFVCANLERMAQIYQKLDVIGVRAVATSAVRDASNQQEFLERAAKALGSPVEIISGQEEARLIHLGVLARWPQAGKRVLMVDVGGGSAEVILSEHGMLAEAFSKPLGAVRLTEVFLRSDPPGAHRSAPHERVHRRKTGRAAAQDRNGPFDRAISTSATAAAIVCAVNRVTARGARMRTA